MQSIKDVLQWAASLDFAYAGTVIAAVVAVSILIVCCHRRKWPDVGEMIACLLAVAGTSSGFKIVILAFYLSADQLGGLRDDRIALVIGGAATIGFALREAVERWIKTVNGAAVKP